MNGSPSVKVALNPRADGSMSPEYTKNKEETLDYIGREKNYD